MQCIKGKPCKKTPKYSPKSNYSAMISVIFQQIQVRFETFIDLQQVYTIR